jgi:putative transposase
MPRTARAIEAGLIYHVLNRGNGRLRLFHDDDDYAAFERVLTEGLARYPVELLSYCIMPNHWHQVVRPLTSEALGRWMGWIGVTHVRRHHQHYHRRGGGHLYQGRFKSFPVSSDEHFLTLCRYVEANARRARLVRRAEAWRWCSLWRRQHRALDLPLAKWPLRRPSDWTARVNRGLEKQSLRKLRECVQRGRPLGDPLWVQETAQRLELGFTLRGPGRPKTKNP